MATIHDKRAFLREFDFGPRAKYAYSTRVSCPQCEAEYDKRIARGDQKEDMRPRDVCPHPSHWKVDRVNDSILWLSRVYPDPFNRAVDKARASGNWAPPKVDGTKTRDNGEKETQRERETETKTETKPTGKGKDLEKGLAGMLEELIRGVVGDLSAETIGKLASRVEALENQPERYKGVEIKTPSSTFKMEGVFHSSFGEILKILLRRRRAYGYGPAGTGKTHMTGQLARALGEAVEWEGEFPWECQSISMGTSEADLTGRLLPVKSGGEWGFVPAPLLKLLKTGGLFAADEFDNGDPNVLVILNTILSNGYVTIPANIGDETIPVHENFYFVAWGNTVGQGADGIYSAREQIDGATRDRFTVSFIYVGYDEALERSLILKECNGDAKIADETQEFVRAVRATIDQAGLERIASMRMARAYAQDRFCGDTKSEVRSRCLVDWAPDDILRLPKEARP